MWDSNRKLSSCSGLRVDYSFTQHIFIWINLKLEGDLRSNSLFKIFDLQVVFGSYRYQRMIIRCEENTEVLLIDTMIIKGIRLDRYNIWSL